VAGNPATPPEVLADLAERHRVVMVEAEPRADHLGLADLDRTTADQLHRDPAVALVDLGGAELLAVLERQHIGGVAARLVGRLADVAPLADGVAQRLRAGAGSGHEEERSVAPDPHGRSALLGERRGEEPGLGRAPGLRADALAQGLAGTYVDVDGDGSVVLGAEQFPAPDCTNPVTECSNSSWYQWVAGFPTFPGMYATTNDQTFEPSEYLAGEAVVTTA